AVLFDRAQKRRDAIRDGTLKSGSQPLSEKEQQEASALFDQVQTMVDAKAGQMRLLRDVDYELRDQNQKIIDATQVQRSLGHEIWTKMDHNGHLVPTHLRIVLAERKMVKEYVEFDGVL